jgi:hypothetical protein
MKGNERKMKGNAGELQWGIWDDPEDFGLGVIFQGK